VTPISQEQTDATIRDFLADHPEHIQGIRQHPEHGTVMDTEALIAFTDWTIKTGRSGNPEMAKSFREELRKQYGK
jgi:hypothetical protein